MEPSNPAAKNNAPVEIAWLESSRSFVCAIVKDHRRACAEAAVTVDRRHVGAGDAIMLEPFVKRLDAHGSNAFGDQLADRIVNHRGGNAGPQTEAVRQVSGYIEFPATHVN